METSTETVEKMSPASSSIYYTTKMCTVFAERAAGFRSSTGAWYFQQIALQRAVIGAVGRRYQISCPAPARDELQARPLKEGSSLSCYCFLDVHILPLCVYIHKKYKYMHIHICTSICTYKYTFTSTNTYTNAYTNTYSYTYTHMHMHILHTYISEAGVVEVGLEKETLSCHGQVRGPLT